MKILSPLSFRDFGWRLTVCNLTPFGLQVLRKRLRNGRLTLVGVGAWTVRVSTWTLLVGDFKCLQLWSELLCITTLRILMVFSICALAKWWTLRFWSTMISWGKSLGWWSSSEGGTTTRDGSEGCGVVLVGSFFSFLGIAWCWRLKKEGCSLN